MEEIEYDFQQMLKKPDELKDKFAEIKNIFTSTTCNYFFKEMQNRAKIIKEKKIKIVFVGVQGAGKSALINSMLTGNEKLPLPSKKRRFFVTEYVCMVEKSNEFSLRPCYKDNRKGDDLLAKIKLTNPNIENIKMYKYINRILQNAKKYLPQNEEKVEYFEVKGPFPRIPENYVLIDTPGFTVEDKVIKHNEVLFEVLQTECHAIMFVGARMDGFLLKTVLSDHQGIKSAENVPVIISAYLDEDKDEEDFEDEEMIEFIEGIIGPRIKETKDPKEAEKEALQDFEKEIRLMMDRSDLFITDYFSRQRVFSQLQKHKIVFPREATLADDRKLQKFFDTCSRMVLMKELTLLSRSILSFFAIGRGQLQLNLRKFDSKLQKFNETKQFALINRRIDKLWDTWIDIGNKKWEETIKKKAISTDISKILKSINIINMDESQYERLEKQILHLAKVSIQELLEAAKSNYIKVVIDNVSANFEDCILKDDKSINYTKRSANDENDTYLADVFAGCWLQNWKMRCKAAIKEVLTNTNLKERIKLIIDQVLEKYKDQIEELERLMSTEPEEEEDLVSLYEQSQKVNVIEQIEKDVCAKLTLDKIWFTIEEKIDYLRNKAIEDCIHFSKQYIKDIKQSVSKQQRDEREALYNWFANQFKEWKELQKRLFIKTNSMDRKMQKADASNTINNLPTPSEIIKGIPKRKLQPKSKPIVRNIELIIKENTKKERYPILEIELNRLSKKIFLHGDQHVFDEIFQFSERISKTNPIGNTKGYVTVCPIFVISYVTKEKDFDYIQFSYNHIYTNRADKKTIRAKEDMLIFFILEKSQAIRYQQHLENLQFKDPHRIVLIKCHDDNLPETWKLDIVKMLAEKFNFITYSRIVHNIKDIAEYNTQLLGQTGCTIGRAVFYGQMVFVSLLNYCRSQFLEYKKSQYNQGFLQEIIRSCSKEEAAELFDLIQLMEKEEVENKAANPSNLARFLDLLPEKHSKHLRQIYDKVSRVCMVGFVEQRRLNQSAAAAYPKLHDIIQYKNIFMHVVVNNTHFQKGVYIYPESAFYAVKSATTSHSSMDEFNLSVKGAEEMYQDKLYRRDFCGIRLANFGYKFNWEHRRIAKLNDYKRGTKRKIVPQGSILQYTKKQKRSEPLIYEMTNKEKELVNKADSFLEQMKDKNIREGRLSSLRSAMIELKQICEKFPVGSRAREDKSKILEKILTKYEKENKLKYPVEENNPE